MVYECVYCDSLVLWIWLEIQRFEIQQTIHNLYFGACSYFHLKIVQRYKNCVKERRVVEMNEVAKKKKNVQKSEPMCECNTFYTPHTLATLIFLRSCVHVCPA